MNKLLAVILLVFLATSSWAYAQDPAPTEPAPQPTPTAVRKKANLDDVRMQFTAAVAHELAFKALQRDLTNPEEMQKDLKYTFNWYFSITSKWIDTPVPPQVQKLQAQNREVRDVIWQLAKDIAELKIDANAAQAQLAAIEKKTQDTVKSAEKMLRQYGIYSALLPLTHIHALDRIGLEMDYLINIGTVAPWQ